MHVSEKEQISWYLETSRAIAHLNPDYLKLILKFSQHFSNRGGGGGLVAQICRVEKKYVPKQESNPAVKSSSPV